MKTVKEPRKLKPKVQEALDLLIAHGENGYLAPEKLDTIKPGWDDRFPSRKWFSGAVERLRRSGRHTLAPTETNGNGATVEESALTPDQQVILDIYKNFRSPSGGIDWQAALVKHPEWSKIIDYPSAPGGRNRGLHILSSMKKKGLLGGKGKRNLSGAARNKIAAAQRARWKKYNADKRNGSANGHATVEPVNEQSVEAQVEARLEMILRESAHCPRCGKNMMVLLRAAAFETRNQ